VTFQRQPVKFGAIFFEPTASVGEVAPTVYLPVRDGEYDAGSEGPVAGKYRVVVGGVDQASKQVDSDGVTHTQPSPSGHANANEHAPRQPLSFYSATVTVLVSV
jgi:hypothetical protein